MRPTYNASFLAFTLHGYHFIWHGWRSERVQVIIASAIWIPIYVRAGIRTWVELPRGMTLVGMFGKTSWSQHKLNTNSCMYVCIGARYWATEQSTGWSHWQLMSYFCFPKRSFSTCGDTRVLMSKNVQSTRWSHFPWYTSVDGAKPKSSVSWTFYQESQQLDRRA